MHGPMGESWGRSAGGSNEAVERSLEELSHGLRCSVVAREQSTQPRGDGRTKERRRASGFEDVHERQALSVHNAAVLIDVLQMPKDVRHGTIERLRQDETRALSVEPDVSVME